MKPYTILAENYDRLLSHVDYASWYTYISKLMNRYVRDPRLVLELGCGTGKFGPKFSADDYEIIGMDRSLDMLRVARARAWRKFHIFCGDMRNFSIARPADFIFSVHDTMNYLLTLEDISLALDSVRRAMHDDSIFMFDITTEYNIYRYFHENEATYRFGDTAITWTNSYDQEKRIVDSLLTFRKNDGTLRKETHRQKIHTREEIEGILSQKGFELLDVFSDYSFEAPSKDTVMINFITRRK